MTDQELLRLLKEGGLSETAVTALSAEMDERGLGPELPKMTRLTFSTSKILKTVVVGALVIIGWVFSQAVIMSVRNHLESRSGPEKALSILVDDISSSCPQEIGEGLELTGADLTSGRAGPIVDLSYTLLNYELDDSKNFVSHNLESETLEQWCSAATPKKRALLKSASIRAVFSDRNLRHITTTLIRLEDCTRRHRKTTVNEIQTERLNPFKSMFRDPEFWALEQEDRVEAIDFLARAQSDEYEEMSVADQQEYISTMMKEAEEYRADN